MRVELDSEDLPPHTYENVGPQSYSQTIKDAHETHNDGKVFGEPGYVEWKTFLGWYTAYMDAHMVTIRSRFEHLVDNLSLIHI